MKKQLEVKGTGFAYMDDPDGYIKKLLETPDSELDDYHKRIKMSYLP